MNKVRKKDNPQLDHFAGITHQCSSMCVEREIFVGKSAFPRE